MMRRDLIETMTPEELYAAHVKWLREFAPAEVVRRKRRAEADRASERVEKGLCYDCNQPAEQGRIRCAKHLQQAREERARFLQRRKAKPGLCRDCNLPAEPGKSRCAKHIELARGYRAKSRSKCSN